MCWGTAPRVLMFCLQTFAWMPDPAMLLTCYILQLSVSVGCGGGRLARMGFLGRGGCQDCLWTGRAGAHAVYKQQENERIVLFSVPLHSKPFVASTYRSTKAHINNVTGLGLRSTIWEACFYVYTLFPRQACLHGLMLTVAQRGPHELCLLVPWHEFLDILRAAPQLHVLVRQGPLKNRRPFPKTACPLPKNGRHRRHPYTRLRRSWPLCLSLWPQAQKGTANPHTNFQTKRAVRAPWVGNKTPAVFRFSPTPAPKLPHNPP